jgi:hypothetical protein
VWDVWIEDVKAMEAYPFPFLYSISSQLLLLGDLPLMWLGGGSV